MGSKAPQPIPPSYEFTRLCNVKGYKPSMLSGLGHASGFHTRVTSCSRSQSLRPIPARLFRSRLLAEELMGFRNEGE
jgi:hypothetical protein